MPVHPAGALDGALQQAFAYVLSIPHSSMYVGLDIHPPQLNQDWLLGQHVPLYKVSIPNLPHLSSSQFNI